MCLDNSSEILIREVRNSFLDCPDLSDKSLCPISLDYIIYETRFENSSVTVPGHYTCGAVINGCLKFKSIHIKETGCNGDNVATNIASENTIRFQAKCRMVDATRCDNIPKCNDFSDKCSECDPEPEFCKNVTIFVHGRPLLQRFRRSCLRISERVDWWYRI